MSLQVVEYPEHLDLGPYMSQAEGEALHYSLYAVLVHSGASCHGGHYFCYTKVVSNFIPSQWGKCVWRGETFLSVLLTAKVLGQQVSLGAGLDFF